MKAEFTAIIEPAPEGGYWAICPEIPGANGQGETIEEAKKNALKAITLHIKSLKKAGEPIPSESPESYKTVVEVAA